MPPASDTTSGLLATANNARISDAVMPAVRAANALGGRGRAVPGHVISSVVWVTEIRSSVTRMEERPALRRDVAAGHSSRGGNRGWIDLSSCSSTRTRRPHHTSTAIGRRRSARVLAHGAAHAGQPRTICPSAAAGASSGSCRSSLGEAGRRVRLHRAGEGGVGLRGAARVGLVRPGRLHATACLPDTSSTPRRSAVPRAAEMPTGPVSADAVLLTTMQVMPEFSGEGLGRMLAQAVVKDLTRRGVKAIEVFGDAAARHRARLHIPADFLRGVGFKTIRPHPRWPRLRMELRSAMTWKEDVEAALEQLLGTITIPLQTGASARWGHRPARPRSRATAARSGRAVAAAADSSWAAASADRRWPVAWSPFELTGQHVAESEGSGRLVVLPEQVEPLDGDQDRPRPRRRGTPDPAAAPVAQVGQVADSTRTVGHPGEPQQLPGAGLGAGSRASRCG